jgi:phage-related protein
VLPTVSEEAFIRQFNHQFDVCYSIAPRVSLVLKHAYERVVASKKTELDTYDPFPINPLGVDLGEEGYTPSLRARNQFGRIFGLGLDVQVSEGAFLFLRHSRFSFEDKNFAETNIKGSETTIELKINF